MSFGQRLRERRIELGMSQAELAKALGVSLSAVSNYENGQNAMREDALLRLFRVLDVDANYLYQDADLGQGFACSVEERGLVMKYRSLSALGRQTLHTVAGALAEYQTDLEAALPPQETRQIPLYRCPAAAGFAAPVFGEDFDYIDAVSYTHLTLPTIA